METVTEKKFLEKEELEKLRLIQEKSKTVILELGEIEVIKFQLENRYQNAKDFLEDLTIEENEFTNSLNEKYGPVSINSENGEISSVD